MRARDYDDEAAGDMTREEDAPNGSRLLGADEEDALESLNKHHHYVVADLRPQTEAEYRMTMVSGWDWYLIKPEAPPGRKDALIVEVPVAPVGVVQPGTLYEPHVGRRVLFQKYAGVKVRINGEDYLLLELKHLLLWLGADDVVEAD